LNISLILFLFSAIQKAKVEMNPEAEFEISA